MKSRIQPFSYPKLQRDIANAVTKLVAQKSADRRRNIITADTTQSYRHGTSFSIVNSNNNLQRSEFIEASVESVLRFRDIIDHDLNRLHRFINKFVDDFERHFMRGFISLMDETTKATGNVVNNSGKLDDDIILMLQKIKFGVDRYGRASMPTMMMHPSIYPKAFEAMQSISTEKAREIDSLIQIRQNEAIADEANRLSRFRVT